MIRSSAFLALLSFIVPLSAYLASGALIPADTMPNAYVAASVLVDGDPVFSPLEVPLMFVWKERQGDGEVLVNVQSWDQRTSSGASYGEELRDGRLSLFGPRYFIVSTQRAQVATGERFFASTFGPTAGLVGLPLLATAVTLGADLSDPFVLFRLAKWTAAALTAGSATLVFLTALAYLSPGRALLLAALYAFGTCVWSISSQALWQQTAALFFLSLGVLCLVRVEGTWLRGLASGSAFAVAAACRPTGAIVLLVAAGYLAWVNRRAVLPYVLAVLPFAFALMAYNSYYFGSPLEFGQLAAGAAVAKAKTGSTELWQTPVWLGAAGLLLSPSRGLLIYTPFLAAAFAGAAMTWRDERYVALRFLTVAVPSLWLPAFAWFDWWGGWTYGYRPIVDSAPLLAVLCVPALAALHRPAWKTAFAVAAAWSVFVQILGVTTYVPDGWNAQRRDGTPANIDLPEHRDRLWSFRDWQIGDLVAQLAAPRR